MSAAVSTASRLSTARANWAAMSPSCSGRPSSLMAVWPEMYRVRVAPETTSPWLNPSSVDHVTGFTAVRFIAAPIDGVATRSSPVATVFTPHTQRDDE